MVNFLFRFSPLLETLPTDGQGPTAHRPEDLSEKSDSSAGARLVPFEVVH